MSAISPSQEHERNYREHMAAGTMTEDLKFTYSWHLIKSKYKKDINKGIRIMEGAVFIYGGHFISKVTYIRTSLLSTSLREELKAMM